MEKPKSKGGVKQINGYDDRVNWEIKAQKKRRRETGDT